MSINMGARSNNQPAPASRGSDRMDLAPFLMVIEAGTSMALL
jgi:hypothetical protein